MVVAFPVLWRTLAPGAPEPVPEYRFSPPRRWRFDWCFPECRLAIEFDGGQRCPGGGRHNTDSDRQKLNTARALGWQVLQFSNRAWADDPAGCIELVQLALAQGRPRSTVRLSSPPP